MQIHLLSGFLGSGKTMAIQAASRLLIENGMKTGVVTNDQGIRLVDAVFFNHLGIPGRQVTNGCFCCNYQDLDDQIQSLSETEQPDVIFAESVGSCTDIIATVLKPLRRYRPQSRITLTVFADALLLHMLLVDSIVLFDESVRYIYDKQLEEAGILILNKVDLLKPDQLLALRREMHKKYGNKILHEQHVADKAGIARWLQLLDQTDPVRVPPSLEIEYPVYGAGEAMLAWFDQEMEIDSPSGEANRGALKLMQDIYRKIKARSYPLGHLKFLFNGEKKISYASTPALAPEFETGPATSATLLLNARVQTEPGKLSQLVEESIREAEEKSGIRIRIRSVSSFRPGYPAPTHRMV